MGTVDLYHYPQGTDAGDGAKDMRHYYQGETVGGQQRLTLINEMGY